MEGAAAAKGVLSRLGQLEVRARSRRAQPRHRGRAEQLEAEAEALRLRREQLQAELQALERLKKMRMSMDKQRTDDEEEEEMDEDSELLQLMARHTQLTDLIQAHHLLGGYDVIKLRQGKGVCVSVATAYEGVRLDTYNLEIDVKPKLRISRHSIPPFIPLNSIAEQSHMQTDIRAFLHALSRHLNAFAGRKQQLEYVKKQKSVEVMESNVLCSFLVLMCTMSKEKLPVLCTLDYTDHTRCLPTRVHFECEDKELTDSPEWKKNCSLLMETPVHKALMAMKKMGCIV